MRFILASESPRRIKLFKQFGIDTFDIIPSITPEVIDESISPIKAIKKIAKHKVLDVLKRNRIKEDFCIVGGDTAVIHNYKIIGKPRTQEEAFNTLFSLGGTSHLVVTGLYVYVKQGEEIKEKSCYSISIVTMRELSQEDILNYMLLDTFWDKAGGYSIEEDPLNFIESYQGSYTNILGFPLEKLSKVFYELKIKKPHRAVIKNKKAQ